MPHPRFARAPFAAAMRYDFCCEADRWHRPPGDRRRGQLVRLRRDAAGVSVSRPDRGGGRRAGQGRQSGGHRGLYRRHRDQAGLHGGSPETGRSLPAAQGVRIRSEGLEARGGPRSACSTSAGNSGGRERRNGPELGRGGPVSRVPRSGRSRAAGVVQTRRRATGERSGGRRRSITASRGGAGRSLCRGALPAGRFAS